MPATRSLNAPTAAAAILLASCALALFALPCQTAHAAVVEQEAQVSVTNQNGKKTGTTHLDGTAEWASYSVPLESWDGAFKTRSFSLESDSLAEGMARIDWVDLNANVAHVSLWGPGTHEVVVRETFLNKKGKARCRIDHSFTAKLKAPRITTPQLTATGSLAATPNLVTYRTNSTKLGTAYTEGELSWASSNESVASVSSDGIVTGLKMGRATITATTSSKLTHEPIVLELPVEVTYKNACLAVRNAYEDYRNAALAYSQADRMKADFRDCSSFVGRCYYDASLGRKHKVIGYAGAKTWSYNTYGQVSWLIEKKKVVSYKAVPVSKLRAGDTIYYGTRTDNSTHVALYVGNGQVLHVSEGMGDYGCVRFRYSKLPKDAAKALEADKTIVCIGRPCK